MVLNRLAYEHVAAEATARGGGFSAALNSIITEHRLLGRIAAAAAFRQAMRDDLNAIRRHAREAAHPGRAVEAVRHIDDRTAAAVNRLVLVGVV